MNRDEYNLWHSDLSKPGKHPFPMCPPFYAWHVSNASDFSSHSGPSSSEQDLHQQKVVRNKAHRACDRCRELRFKCKKVNGEECSLCTKCVSSGQDCTYLRPVGRPGPTPGAFKRTPTLRDTLFSKRRALSPADFKGSEDGSISLGSTSMSPKEADYRVVHTSVNLTESYVSGLQTDSGGISSCSQEEVSGSLGRILDTSWSCSSAAKSPGADVQQNSNKLKGDVKSHRPLLWTQSRDLLYSTTVRNKKHLFAD